MDVPSPKEMRGTSLEEKEVRSIIRKAIKRQRHIIAARMTKILGRNSDPITPAMFADFLRDPSRRRSTRFPAAWVRAFCDAVGSDELWRYLGPESARRTLAASAGILESREAVARAQEALNRVQADLEKLAEGRHQRKSARRTKR